MALVYVLLVAHFVADFVCQSNWMAVNKGKRWDALAWHVLVYAAVLGLVVSFALPPSPYPYDSLALFGLWWAVNAAAHFAQDAITSRINAKFWFVGGARLTLKGQDELVAVFNAMDVLSPVEAFRGARMALTEPGCHEIDFDDAKRHWFFVAIGFDQLLHYVTLFVTAQWWLL